MLLKHPRRVIRVKSSNNEGYSGVNKQFSENISKMV